RAVRVDLKARVGRIAVGQELLIAIPRVAVVAQPHSGSRTRAELSRRAHGVADLLLLPDDDLGAEVVEREGHLRRCPAPVAGAHPRPDLGGRRQQFISPEGVLAEPQYPVTLANPGLAKRVGQPAGPLI